MPEFQPSYGLQDYLNGADDHYRANRTDGLPNEEPVRQTMPTKQSSSMPKRKPVGSAGKAPQVPMTSPYPAMTPTRPVESRLKVQPRQQTANSLNLDKPLPRVPHPQRAGPQPSPRIYTNKDGWFDPATIKPLNVQPVKSQSSFRLPAGPQRESDRPAPASPATSRPESSSGWSFRNHKRRDSNASNASAGSRSSSRRGSFTEALKDARKWVSNTVKIAGMTPAEREKHNEGIRRYEAHKAEADRKANLASRPIEEQRYIVERHIALNPNCGLDEAHPEHAYAALIEKKEEKAFRREAREQNRAKAAAEVGLVEGMFPRSPSLPSNKSSPSPKFSIRAADRQIIHEKSGVLDEEVEVKARPKMIGGVQGKVSKVLDPFKKERKGSDSSSMDFGMTDEAPPDALLPCGSVLGPNYRGGCGEMPKSYLNNGLCELCHYQKKHHYDTYPQDDLPPPPASQHTKPRVKGHNPISPEDDAATTAAGNDLYIRLPNQHKLRKVRETLYEDPGNPFSISKSSPPALPPPRDSGVYFDDDYLDNNTGPWSLAEDSNISTTGHNGTLAVPKANEGHLSLLSDPFDLASIADATPDATRSSSLDSGQPIMHAPAPLRRGTPTIVRDTLRRSMSVDIGFLPPFTYGKDQSFSWDSRPEQRRSVSDGKPEYHFHFPSASGTAFTAGAARDQRRESEFYRFYDEVLAEYAS